MDPANVLSGLGQQAVNSPMQAATRAATGAAINQAAVPLQAATQAATQAAIDQVGQMPGPSVLGQIPLPSVLPQFGQIPLQAVYTQAALNQVGQVPLDDEAPSPERHMDMIEREAYDLTPHVSIGFTDIFMESKDIKGFSFMDKVNGAIYKYTHFVNYALCTFIYGPFLAFWWATFFAAAHFIAIWVFQPFLKTFFVAIRLFRMFYEPFVRCLLDPIFHSASLVFSGIKGNLKLNRSDITVNMKTSQRDV